MPTPVEPPPTTAMSHGSRRLAMRCRKASRWRGPVEFIRFAFVEGAPRGSSRALLPRARAAQRFAPAAAPVRAFIGAHARLESAIGLPGARDLGTVLPK